MEIQNVHVRQTGIGINFTDVRMEKIDLVSNNLSRKGYKIRSMLTQKRADRKPTMGFRLAL